MSCSIVVLVNAKGGPGATTLAVEAARDLTTTTLTAVVDAELLGRRTMAVMLDMVRQLDSNRSLAIYSVVDNGGLTTVELTDSYDDAFALSSEGIEGLVDELSQKHELLIVDAP
ncbi:MAG: hypothetical protein IAI50_03065 [Candidatus Eremiobacteraeota bacterium]|nr:hypothetical protein [Candidatus Eremiobacteraeota bacterium]